MLLLLILFGIISGEIVRSDTDVFGTLFGVGVCSIHRHDTKQVLILKTHFYIEMGYSLCWHFPPWCKTPTGRELKEFITIPENLNHEILSLKCCDGYYPSKDDLSCIPICSEHCLPTKCLRPNICSECKTGYHGSTCIKDTPPNATTTSSPPTPGVCKCPNENFMCNHNLKCVCLNGFDGPTCQHIIPSHQIIVNPDKCSDYVKQVGLLVTALAASAILLAILMRKRVCWSNTFQPLDDSIVPSV